VSRAVEEPRGDRLQDGKTARRVGDRKSVSPSDSEYGRRWTANFLPFLIPRKFRNLRFRKFDAYLNRR
jgi:hypothetical protein